MIRRKKKNFNMYAEDIEYMDEWEDGEEEQKEEVQEEAPAAQEASVETQIEEDADQTEPEDPLSKKSGKKRFFGRRKKKNIEEQILEDEQKSEDSDLIEENPELAVDEKRPISRKKIAAAVGVAVVAVGVIGCFIVSNMDSGDDGKAYVESVGVITGLGSANGMNNRYTGEVEAQNSWKITLQSDMSVAKCYVEVGDQVKKGDKLFSYNTEELKLNQEKKELDVETLQNEITQLNKDIKGYQEDLKSASASEKIELQTQILTAQTTIKKNEYSIKSGKEEIKTLKKNIKDATVKSKMDGVVKKINTNLGQASSEEDEGYDESTGDSNVYMTVLAIGDYRVKGKISETNVWSINEGDPVIVRSRVDDTKIWNGSISKINTDSTSEEDSTDETENYDDYSSEGTGESASSYSFYVDLEEDEGLMMGQHVLIEPNNGQDENKSGMWLPAAYIHIEGKNYYVWVANKRDRLVLQKVEVGEYNEELEEYEILSGLDLDDYIACDGENLKENMKVTKTDDAESSTDYYDEESSDDYVYGDDLLEEDFLDEGSYDDSDYVEDVGSDDIVTDESID